MRRELAISFWIGAVVAVLMLATLRWVTDRSLDRRYAACVELVDRAGPQALANNRPCVEALVARARMRRGR